MDASFPSKPTSKRTPPAGSDLSCLWAVSQVPFSPPRHKGRGARIPRGRFRARMTALGLVAAACAQAPATAEVTASGAGGFAMKIDLPMAAPPDRVFERFLEIGRWWGGNVSDATAGSGGIPPEYPAAHRCITPAPARTARSWTCTPAPGPKQTLTGLLPVPAPAGSWLSTLTVRDFQLVDEMDRADVDLRARQFAGPGPTKPSLFASVGTSFAATRL